MRFQLSDKVAQSGRQRIDALAAFVSILLLSVAAAMAEQEPAEPAESAQAESMSTVIKATQYIDVNEVESVLRLLGVHFAIKPDQNLIVIRGERHAVDTALKVIDALDEPRPSIDLHIYVLSASKEGNVDVPDGLQPTVDHLRGIFGFTGFQLLDSVMLRVLEGREGRVKGGIRLGTDTERSAYHFSFRKVSLESEPGEDRVRNIRLKRLRFEVAGSVAGSVRASLETDVQIREGQKAVIGSSTPNGIGETLILIVEATAGPDPSWKTEPVESD